MLFVGIGGMLGAISRYLLGKWISQITSDAFPLGTFIINISGSFALGILTAMHLQKGIPEWSWLMLGPGYLGAYTTFSTFGYETIRLLQHKMIGIALLYVTASVILSVICAFIGFTLF